jgi:hypothetical protein
MTIDLERLKVDADYWNQVAPEGATHFMYSEKFVKWVDGVELSFYVSSERKWKKSFCSWSLQQYIDCGNYMIAKPSKPAAQEWDGTGLPPVGTRVICLTCSGWSANATIVHVTITGIAIAEIDDGSVYHSSCAEKFCPIRSQAEREREPVIIAALRAADPPADDEIHPRQYLIDSLNILYDAGMLRMPDEDVAKKARGEL